MDKGIGQNLKLMPESMLKMNNGLDIPVLGLGVWQAKAGREVEDAVIWALETGYRLIDTARIYGNEEGVGRAIRKSKIPRDQIFLTTKLWNEDQGYETALAAIDQSLERLEMDYVDLYLIHWPFMDRNKGENRREETWKAMEEIYKSGKAKAIGVSNYTVKHLEEMKAYAKIMPAINQVEFHPFLYQKELLDYCRQNNIIVEAYSPLAHASRINDKRIAAVAEKYRKSNAQVLIRWSLQHGNVVIPKSVHKERIRENFNVFDFELSGQDMLALDALNENFRTAWDPNT
jgi:methylglyoxal/glyoxal reductase